MKISFILLFFLFLCFQCYPQNHKNEFSVLFYNVENLFDPESDSDSKDNEFTPAGDRHWTYKKLNQKLLNISKVILNASGWNTPEIVALCEVENRKVLEKLISTTPLQKISYKIIHKESPDHRGIDVALLYNSDIIEPLKYDFYPLTDGELILETREILYFSGIQNKKDTLHFFVNHWPSRYDGLLETKSKRIKAAKLLKSKVDELNQEFKNPKIIIIGDFNDQPSDESISEFLGAKKIDNKTNSNQLYNLSIPWQDNKSGTIKYQSQWSVFDQIIVSGSLLENKSETTVRQGDASIVKFPFLFENDEKYGGLKPKRSYIGFSYQNGFSDHLPVLLKLNSSN